MTLFEIMATLTLTVLCVFGAVQWFVPEYDRQVAQAEKSTALSAADTWWRATYLHPRTAAAGSCIDEALLEENMVGYFGSPCITPASTPGWRMHQMLDCAAAHADMAAPGTHVEPLLEDRWELRLQPGRLSGQLAHVGTGLHRDWTAPRRPLGVGQVVADEVAFPRQRYGEVFASTLAGGGVAGSVFRPLQTCVELR